jgi:hypothetical protein
VRGGDPAHASVIRGALPRSLPLLGALLLYGALLAQPPAATAAPAWTPSRYVDTLSHAYHERLGCAAASRRVSGVTVLLYGKPVRVHGTYGASLYGGPDATTGQIASAVKRFALGYVACARGTFVNLIVATSNCCGRRSEVHYEHGRAWARMVNGIGSWLTARGYAGRVRVRGGSDMEPGYNSAARTWRWWNGYHSVNRHYLYNLGSADGCPQYGTGRTNGICNNGWRQSDVYGLSWRGWAVPLPQIYREDGAQARQWQQIKLYGVVSRGRSMTIMGPLTQALACRQRGTCVTTDNTPSRAWLQLYSALNADPRTRQSLAYSTDIGWR